jgi:hypothetical protein
MLLKLGGTVLRLSTARVSRCAAGPNGDRSNCQGELTPGSVMTYPATAPRRVGDRDRASVADDDVVDDRQTEPGMPGLRAFAPDRVGRSDRTLFALVRRRFRGRRRRPSTSHPVRRHGERDPDAAGGVSSGVVEHVAHDPRQLADAAPNPRRGHRRTVSIDSLGVSARKALASANTTSSRSRTSLVCGGAVAS